MRDFGSVQTLLFFAALSVVSLCTWSFFVSLGSRTGGLLPTRVDRDAWLASQNPEVVKLQNVAAIAGTLTSFGTVFIFYLGYSKTYGIFVLATLLALYLSHYVTNWVTRRILSQDHLRIRSTEADQAGAAIARMFWSTESVDQHITRIVQVISLMSVLGIVWLEFSLLTKYLWLITLQTLPVALGFMFLLSFGVVWFTLRYGVRGFVFADLIQVPILGLSFIILCATTVWLWSHSTNTLSPWSIADLMQPVWWGQSERYSLIPLFVVHVFALNLFLPLVLETHWLRLWAFKETEITMQRAGLTATVLLAIPLIIAGTLVYYLSNGTTGQGAVIIFVDSITRLSPVFGFVFWVAALAALFSTADTHIYAALVLSRFNARTGEMSQGRRSPFILALFSSVLFVIFYALVEINEIRFDKIMFVVVPSALILLPPIIELARGAKPSVFKLYAAALGYWGASIYGLVSPSREFEANLIAALVPVILAFVPVRKDLP